jgi:release factor glutamine methyltransferase
VSEAMKQHTAKGAGVPPTCAAAVAALVEQLADQLGDARAGRVRADWLMASLLGRSGLDWSDQAERVLRADEWPRWQEMVARVLRHEPVQYILGETEFMGWRLRCDRRALIPRPETEALVDAVLAGEPAGSTPRVIDVGTGSGCVAIALAKALPGATVVAIDRDADALALARENVALHGLGERVTLRQGSLLEGCAPGSADLVVANLPYISTADCAAVPAEVADYEPRQALDGGVSGLDAITALIAQAPAVLSTHGRLWLEIGEQQGAAVVALLQAAGFQSVAVQPDWTGRDRIVRGILP